MKRNLIAAFLMMAMSVPLVAEAQEKTQRILLRDKSVVIGQVLALKDGIYTIKAEAMGEFKIGADKILSISSLEHADKTQKEESAAVKDNGRVQPGISIRDGANPKKQRQTTAGRPESTKPSGTSDLARQQEQVTSRVQSMTMNSEFLDSMMDLNQNSSMMDIMSDPEIMDAISRGDYDFLMNSDKMKQLMDSDEIKNLLGDIQP